ncbi:MAG: methyltransferase domain-containing protein, partial [Ignavibacteriaceae bacterium]|nr:methyltransferase domain-containing protein [Ignavibacteriaceae bacterium]
IKSDIRNFPFPSGYADLISLRFVVEHFKCPDEYIPELKRVLKGGGEIIILTTNLLSPFIFLPRLILPYSLKQKILTKLFKVKNDDVFPTYHKLNSPAKFDKLKNDFIVKEIKFISDLNYIRKWMFLILLLWHKMTGLKMLNKLRTNILVILEKK